MARARARAYPRKHFFIEMFTRDISLADCVLDLIDNSIDALIRNNKIKVDESLLKGQDKIRFENDDIPWIKVNFSEKSFSISDNCGGISYTFAHNGVFNFGYGQDYYIENSKSGLGVYGVGLKRAIFKVGDYFRMESHTEKDGFLTEVDSLRKWAERDEAIEDWTFPIEKLESAKSDKTAGTKLTIKYLREEVKTAIADVLFVTRLHNEVARVFALFLESHVRVYINDEVVHPLPIPFGESDEVKAGFKKYEEDGVHVSLYVSLAKRGLKGEWKSEQAGWYIACNGRLVVTANKDDLTGWGSGSLPSYHSKYRGFVGLALFSSSSAYALPWTTTKRGINLESLVYQKIKIKMREIARPVLSFLDRMYPGDLRDMIHQREIADSIEDSDVRKISGRAQSVFKVTPGKVIPIKTTVRIQYNAKKIDIEKVRKFLRDPHLSYSEIGRITFDDYVKKLD